MKTPLVLWVFVWTFVFSLTGFLGYEIYALLWKKVPTISSLVYPNVRTHLYIAIPLAILFLAFIGFLIYDWFFWIRPLMKLVKL